MKFALAGVCLLLVSVPCIAQVSQQEFIVNAASNCPGYSEGQYFAMPAGDYIVEWESGAMSPFDETFDLTDLVWQAWIHIYIYSTAESITIGAPLAPGWYASYALAEAAALGTYPLHVATNSTVAFYIYDFAGCGDNRGEIMLKFVPQLATEAKTWGAIKALYR
jgi:hypothetical protein